MQSYGFEEISAALINVKCISEPFALVLDDLLQTELWLTTF